MCAHCPFQPCAFLSLLGGWRCGSTRVGAPNWRIPTFLLKRLPQMDQKTLCISGFMHLFCCLFSRTRPGTVLLWVRVCCLCCFYWDSFSANIPILKPSLAVVLIMELHFSWIQCWTSLCQWFPAPPQNSAQNKLPNAMDPLFRLKACLGATLFLDSALRILESFATRPPKIMLVISSLALSVQG